MKEEKYSEIELNLAEFDREILEYIIKLSCEKDISVNKVIENILTNYINSQNETRNV